MFALNVMYIIIIKYNNFALLMIKKIILLALTVKMPSWQFIMH